MARVGEVAVTAPVAMGIAEKTGGTPALPAVFSVMTDLTGALAGKYLFDLLRIPAAGERWRVRGFALGASSHGIGAASQCRCGGVCRTGPGAVDAAGVGLVALRKMNSALSLVHQMTADKLVKQTRCKGLIGNSLLKSAGLQIF